MPGVVGWHGGRSATGSREPTAARARDAAEGRLLRGPEQPGWSEVGPSLARDRLQVGQGHGEPWAPHHLTDDGRDGSAGWSYGRRPRCRHGRRVPTRGEPAVLGLQRARCRARAAAALDRGGLGDSRDGTTLHGLSQRAAHAAPSPPARPSARGGSTHRSGTRRRRAGGGCGPRGGRARAAAPTDPAQGRLTPGSGDPRRRARARLGSREPVGWPASRCRPGCTLATGGATQPAGRPPSACRKPRASGSLASATACVGVRGARPGERRGDVSEIPRGK
jgi:hypothetical protein